MTTCTQYMIYIYIYMIHDVIEDNLTLNFESFFLVMLIYSIILFEKLRSQCFQIDFGTIRRCAYPVLCIIQQICLSMKYLTSYYSIGFQPLQMRIHVPQLNPARKITQLSSLLVFRRWLRWKDLTEGAKIMPLTCRLEIVFKGKNENGYINDIKFSQIHHFLH